MDDTPESARAAALGWKIAQRAETGCQIVHVVRDYTSEVFSEMLPPDTSGTQAAVAQDARTRIESALAGTLPPEALNQIEIHQGRPAALLTELAADAELLVLGGKHHSTLGRWLVGSTAHQVVRMSQTPVLMVGASAEPPRRILTAVDLSAAAALTLRAAQRLATLFSSELRVLHVVEPLPPVITDFGIIRTAPMTMGTHDWYATGQEHFERRVWPLVDYPGATRVVVAGNAETEIRREVSEWGADLLVAGTHGQGPIDRILIGSVSHHLLNDLPTSLLMVPVHVPAAGSGRKRKPKTTRAARKSAT